MTTSIPIILAVPSHPDRHIARYIDATISVRHLAKYQSARASRRRFTLGPVVEFGDAATLSEALVPGALVHVIAHGCEESELLLTHRTKGDAINAKAIKAERRSSSSEGPLVAWIDACYTDSHRYRQLRTAIGATRTIVTTTSRPAELGTKSNFLANLHFSTVWYPNLPASTSDAAPIDLIEDATSRSAASVKVGRPKWHRIPAMMPASGE